MKKQRLTQALIAGLVLLATGAVVFYGQSNREYRSEEFLMDTLVSIRVFGRDTDLMRESVRQAFDSMREINDLTDRFARPGTASFAASDICRLNSQAGVQPVSVHEDVYAMLELAKMYGELSQGMFDITIGPVMDVWGFGQPGQKVPSEQELKQALANVDFRKVILNQEEQTAFLSEPGMTVDLGAIAKGYATERAARILQAAGIKRGLIDAGGNVRVIGDKGPREPWAIGVQDPENPDNLVAVLQLSDEAAVTSGDYNRYFVQEGKRYHHLISPLTGYPAGQNRSVTIVAKDGGKADILSTSLFMMEPEQALLQAQANGVEAVIVTADRRILLTPGLKRRAQVLPGEVYYYDESR